MDIRFISNNISGFAFYSETDRHRTYVFDREGFRFVGEDPSNPCLAAPTDGSTTFTPDAVPGLDTDDEVVFMAADAGARAESSTTTTTTVPTWSTSGRPAPSSSGPAARRPAAGTRRRSTTGAAPRSSWASASVPCGPFARPGGLTRTPTSCRASSSTARRCGSGLPARAPHHPLDGIYAQWDYNAGMVDTHYNPQVTDGVAIDGRNDDVLGNSRMYIGSDGVMVEDDGLREFGIESGRVEAGSPRGASGGCAPDGACLNNDVDTADPRFSGVNVLLNWEQITGPYGTLVSRMHAADVSPGGAAHAVAAMPYYRDDASFDGGTGTNPGPHLHRRGLDEGSGSQEWETWVSGVDADGNEVRSPREHGAGQLEGLGTPRYYQGSIGTHGMHLLFIADSDNAHTTAPLTEIVAEQRIVVLPGRQPNVGELYAGSTQEELEAVVTPRRPL